MVTASDNPRTPPPPPRLGSFWLMTPPDTDPGQSKSIHHLPPEPESPLGSRFRINSVLLRQFTSAAPPPVASPVAPRSIKSDNGQSLADDINEQGTSSTSGSESLTITRQPSVASSSEQMEHFDLRPTTIPHSTGTSATTGASAAEDDDDDDIVFTGANLPSGGRVTLGKRRRIEQPAQIEDEDEDELREVDQGPHQQHRGCPTCGCFCHIPGFGKGTRGSGSTTLSPQVLGRLLKLLLGNDQSLLSMLGRLDHRITTWADIAEVCGARREDFDRVRHAARGMQQELPIKKARGMF